jgi:hypothetical protein
MRPGSVTFGRNSRKNIETNDMKPLLKIGLVLGQTAVVLVAFRAGEVIKAGQMSAKPWGAYTSQIPPGVALNPVPLKVENRDAGVILRGSYLVNAAQHCNFCHTCPPYATNLDQITPGQSVAVNAVNYMAGGRRFGLSNDTNALTSPNLTPDLRTGLPGGLTFTEFQTALRSGRSHKTGRSLEFMPWPMFKDLTDTDLLAIYEYLGAIPHAQPGPDYPQGIGPRSQRTPAKPEA